MKHELTAAIILVIAVLTGMAATNPAPDVFHKTDTVPAIPDTLSMAELKKQIAGVLPDSIVVPDSLLFNRFSDMCNGIGYNMPELEPDDELTSSMPQVKPESVDQGILIPGFMECLNVLKERKERQ